PHITAPSDNILAACTPVSPPSDMQNGRHVVNYNIRSGASMVCPHVSVTHSPLAQIKRTKFIVKISGHIRRENIQEG
ncbi:hypothetical protein KI387_027673, partial [Taxus chinensis]